MRWGRGLWMLGCVLSAATAWSADEVGKRPYEMDWAGRTTDIRPATVDFEDLAGWTVASTDAQASLLRTRRQQLWGQYVGQLTYRGTGPRPVVRVQPPRAIPLPSRFDCANFWVYGNNWAWAPDPTTPPVEIALVLRAKGGAEVRLSMGSVYWEQWWVMHRKLTSQQLRVLGDGASLVAIEVVGGRNIQDRSVWFDNLSFYTEPLPPLHFEPRPQRNMTPLPGQIVGANLGPDRLPFPTRDQTILPSQSAGRCEVRLVQQGDAYVWRYRGDDGELVYRYAPSTGTLGDVTAHWIGRGEAFRPMSGGGIVPVDGAIDSGGDKPRLVQCVRDGDTVVARWEPTRAGRTTSWMFRMRVLQKSLVIDVLCPGGNVGEVRFGEATGVDSPRLVTVPYWVGDSQRPAVLVTGPADRPLFVTGIVDHYRSNASSLWASNQTTPRGTTYNGGSRYDAKTDGRRNDCVERLFLTVSPRFDEVLPNVPNPKSPWMHVAGERLWIAHAASSREADYALWKRVARHGMTKVVITDHETGWRDGGESFTLRTRAAPGKGGDEGQVEYAKKIRALGFRYGIYNNYTDFAPVNEHWSEDRVTRLSDGQFQPAWPRCYSLKPSRAVELEAQLAPIIQKKFQLDTAYCDVHTAVMPWAYCDRDARVPGAATFTATLFAYGEIMLHQKQTWNGPVYSEGNNHWYYCGLTDGNYGQDQAARLPENPWLVDFDLLKLHPLCCNFGMGNPGMFYGETRGLGHTPQQREVSLDRFLAATLAFGHTGFLVLDGGMESAAKSYFSVQQVHAAYAQATAKSIRYADAAGTWHDTSSAVAGGAYRRSQLAVQYDNGVKVYVNGHPTENCTTPEGPLPPNGWHAHDATGKLVAWSKLVDGRRADYVDSPAYIYADGRGRLTRFPKAWSDGPLAVHKRTDGSFEAIPIGRCTHWGVDLGPGVVAATALNESGGVMGPAQTRASRGATFIVPAPGAFSYRLTVAQSPAGAKPIPSASETDWKVAPGQTVHAGSVGAPESTFHTAKDAKPGEVVWQRIGDRWLHFLVVPLVDARLSAGAALELDVAAGVPLRGMQLRLADAHWRWDAQQPVLLRKQVSVPFTMTREEVRQVPLSVAADGMEYTRNWWLKIERGYRPMVSFPETFDAGECVRRGVPRSIGGSGAAVLWTERGCGDVARRCLFMHPPYEGGIGYSYATFTPMALPAAPAASLRCLIGKADGSDPGDGILFSAIVVEQDGRETVVARRSWIAHAWSPLEADLGRWAGKTIRLKLVADAGPDDNAVGDWACWADLRVESTQRQLVPSLHDQAVQLTFQAGPHPLPGLSTDALRKATRGRLRFQGIGLQDGAPYISYGELNNVALGKLPAAGGDEVRGVWSDASIELPAKALAMLDRENRFSIDNPGRDSFKIRRVWLDLELADGRRASSDVFLPAHTQPAGWPYGEGIGVPFRQRIEIPLRFSSGP